MLSNLVKSVTKEIVLAPVKVVEGVAEAIDEVTDPKPKRPKS